MARATTAKSDAFSRTSGMTAEDAAHVERWLLMLAVGCFKATRGRGS